MRLFTIVLDWRGGTYLAQEQAESPGAAIAMWSVGRPSDQDELKGVRDCFRNVSDAAVAIDGLQGVWCASAIVDGDLALVHIVQGAVLDDL